MNDLSDGIWAWVPVGHPPECSGKLKDMRVEPRRKEVTFVNHDKLGKSVNQEGGTKLKENNFFQN